MRFLVGKTLFTNSGRQQRNLLLTRARSRGAARVPRLFGVRI